MKRRLSTALLATLLIALPAKADEGAASVVNELLRGELSAVETYRQALEKVGDEPGAEKLHAALNDHQHAVEELRTQVTRLGGTPVTDSGAWGAWAKTVVASAKVLGDQAALKALKEGEEHGVKEYKEVLENDNVPADIKSMVTQRFLPAQERHIADLNSLMTMKATKEDQEEAREDQQERQQENVEERRERQQEHADDHQHGAGAGH